MSKPSEPKIASLISSATEILCALGLRPQMVARSHECDSPTSILSLESVTSPKFPTDGTSYEIDQRLRAILQEGLSVYRVDAERLKALNVTHIVTQTQCHVCAVSLDDVKCALNDWMSWPVNIVNLKGEDLEGVFLDIREVARVFSRELKGEDLLRSLKSRLQALWAKTRGLSKQKRVFIIEWIEPLLSAGHWMPELAEMAGLEMLFAKKGHGSARLSWGQVHEAEPDLIVVAPCGFGIERSLQELKRLSENPEWLGLNAVKKNQVFVADGNQFFNRPGPRLVETAEILAEIAYPEVFQFGHRVSHWQNVDIH